MPNYLRTQAIHNLREFTELVEDLMGSSDPKGLWYRGTGLNSHQLVPNLYRHPTIVEPEQLVLLETTLLSWFKQRSIPYQPRLLGEDWRWDYLFLMQHVGVPSRLLDWTENPFIALYFALSDAVRQATHTGFAGEPAVVWVLNPQEWNRAVLAHASYGGDVLTTNDEWIKNYAPESEWKYMPNLPVAMYGMHNSPRIVAQRGVFTIFGQDKRPIEATYIDLLNADGALVKVEVPAVVVHNLRQSLLRIGYRESVIFPDLDGLARELRRDFGFDP